jgi:hypothetical protein
MFIAHPTGLEPLLGKKSPFFETLNTFKELMDFLGHAPESERVGQLLADFAARVGRRNGERTCLGILKPSYNMIGAILLARHCGLAFSFETRKSDKEKLIYVESRATFKPSILAKVTNNLI